MSLAARASVSLGSVTPWHPRMVDGFVPVVVRLLRLAHERLVLAAFHTSGWKENQFAAALYVYLQQLRDADTALNILAFHDERRFFDERVLRGEIDPDASPRIDLSVRHAGMRSGMAFGVEAKVLTDRSVGNRRPGKSIEYYVSDGVMRFVAGKYDSSFPAAAIVAFVISGTAVATAKRIAKEMLSVCPGWKSSTLSAHHPTDSPEHYASKHPTPSGTMTLHHLLMTTRCAELPESDESD